MIYYNSTDDEYDDLKNKDNKNSLEYDINSNDSEKSNELIKYIYVSKDTTINSDNFIILCDMTSSYNLFFPSKPIDGQRYIIKNYIGNNELIINTLTINIYDGIKMPNNIYSLEGYGFFAEFIYTLINNRWIKLK